MMSLPFKPSLMFLGKARRGVPKRCTTGVCSGLKQEHLTRLERLAAVQKFANYSLKKFYNIVVRVNFLRPSYTNVPNEPFRPLKA